MEGCLLILWRVLFYFFKYISSDIYQGKLQSCWLLKAYFLLLDFYTLVFEMLILAPKIYGRFLLVLGFEGLGFLTSRQCFGHVILLVVLVAALAFVVDHCPNVGSSAPASCSLIASQCYGKENGTGKREKLTSWYKHSLMSKAFLRIHTRFSQLFSFCLSAKYDMLLWPFA